MSKCQWRYDDDCFVFNAECGAKLQREVYGIKEHEFKYCPYCGGEIETEPTNHPMPASLHRTLWGVIPGGYWIAYDSDLEVKWFSDKPNQGKTCWVHSKPGSSSRSGTLPNCFMPLFHDVEWTESAMQMPMEPPEDALRKAAERVVEVFVHDGVSQNQAIQVLKKELEK